VSRVHPQARTTPRTRAEIHSSKASLTEVAVRYNVTKATARKWRGREDMQDRSHCPNALSTILTPAQEALVVELRRTLLLALDDLLAITHEFINPAASRSGLDHCLRRHGVSQLKTLIPQIQGEPAAKKTFRSGSGQVLPFAKKAKIEGCPDH
jgi:transposase-like protein